MELPQINDSWHKDIPAGIVVFLVALPLCIGIAIASGVPPMAGIVSGIIGGVIVGILSNSAVAVSGPAAGLILIMSDAIKDIGSFEAILVAVALAGVIQLVIGYLKGGILGEYFPSAVIKGMLAAIGLTLILHEVPHALGYDQVAMGENRLLGTGKPTAFEELYNSFIYPSFGAIIITAVSLGVLLLWEVKKIKETVFARILPAELIVVVLGVGINAFYLSEVPSLYLDGEHLVIIPDFFSEGARLSSFLSFPDFSALGKYNTYLYALVIAGVASLETLLSVDAADRLDPFKRHTDKNRELKAQGTGNLLAGLLGGLPMTAVIVRSSANINAGGRTKMAAIIHGVLLLVCLLMIPGALNMIPLACLAAILLKIGYKLSRVELYKSMYRAGKPRFIVFITTISAIMLTDLMIGIVIGVIVSVFFILKDNYRYSFSKIEKEILEERSGRKIKQTEIIFSENLSILNKASLNKMLMEVEEGSIVILNARSTKNIDYDTLEVIRDFIVTSERKGIDIYYIEFDKFFPKMDIDNLTKKTIAANTIYREIDISQHQVR